MTQRTQEHEGVSEDFGEGGQSGMEFLSHGKADSSFARTAAGVRQPNKKNFPTKHQN